MPSESITYRAGYEYQLTADYSTRVDVYPVGDVETHFVRLTRDGDLLIRRGYAWDGPSGPAMDTPSFMRGSLVHDALYQLMREGHIAESNRDRADRILQRMCVEDGMPSPLAWLVYQAVSSFGDPFADPAQEKPPETAP